MTTHITFRLPQEVIEGINQYQARHKLKSQGEALCKIYNEWKDQDSKKDQRIKELEEALKKKVEAEGSVQGSPQEVSSNGDKEDFVDCDRFKRSFDVMNGKVDCPRELWKDHKLTGKIMGLVPVTYCELCNERYRKWKEQGKSIDAIQKRRDQAIKEGRLPFKQDGMPGDRFYCAWKDQSYAKSELIKLPCLDDVALNCKNNLCHAKVLETIGYHKQNS